MTVTHSVLVYKSTIHTYTKLSLEFGYCILVCVSHLNHSTMQCDLLFSFCHRCIWIWAHLWAHTRTWAVMVFMCLNWSEGACGFTDVPCRFKFRSQRHASGFAALTVVVRERWLSDVKRRLRATNWRLSPEGTEKHTELCQRFHQHSIRTHCKYCTCRVEYSQTYYCTSQLKFTYNSTHLFSCQHWVKKERINLCLSIFDPTLNWKITQHVSLDFTSNCC